MRLYHRRQQSHSGKNQRTGTPVEIESLEGRAYLSTTLQWRPLGDPGVGGQVTSLAVSPFDSKLVLGGGDILGIARSTDGGSTWLPAQGLGNGGGGQLVEQFTFHPTNPNIIWAGTMRGPFVSLDAGKTWTLQRRGMPGWGAVNFVAPIQKVLFDPSDSTGQRLLAFTGNHRRNVADSTTPRLGEVWESSNGGANWTLKSTIVAGKHIENAVYKTGSPDTLFAVCGGNFYRSFDDGATWAQSGTGLPAGNLTWLTVSPNDGNRIFVATRTNGVWLSTDGGSTFIQKATGLRLGAGAGNFIEVDQNPNDGKEVIYFGYPDDGASGGSGTRGVYKSTNGGDSWTKLSSYGPTAYPNYGDIKPIAIDPNNADTAFFGTNGNIWRTINGGASVQDVTATQTTSGYFKGTGWSGQVSWNVKFNPFNPNESAVLGMDSGKWISRDDQQTWIFGGGGRNKGLYDWSGALDIAFTNTSGPSEVLYLTQGQYGGDVKLYKTSNGGLSWTGVSEPYAIASGEKREDYFKFDLSTLSASPTSAILRVKVASVDASISAGSPAYLSVTGSNGNLSTGAAYDTWSQSTATWSILKNGWENSTSRLDAKPVTAAGQFVDLDVTSFIKSEYSGDKKATLKISEATRLLKLLSLASLESGADAPQLIINGTTSMTPTDDTFVRDGTYSSSTAGGLAIALELKNGTSGEYQGVHADYNSPNRVWAVRSGRLFYSSTSGSSGSWVEVGFETGGINTITGDSSDPTGNTIYLGTDTGVWKTTDGANFTKIGSGPTNVARVKLDPTNSSNIFAVASGLWKWNGSSWSRISADDSIADVAVDPTNGNRVVYGSSYNPFQSDTEETGVWLSEDGGNTWSRQNRGLGNWRAYNLAFKPGTSRLVLGTRDNGYYVTDLSQPAPQGTVLAGSTADFDIREGSGLAADGNGVVNSTTNGISLIGRSDSTNNQYATVLVFQLPDIGGSATPFSDAQLNVFLSNSGVNTFYAGNVDLYGLGVRSTSTGQASDYFLGSFDTTDATLISDNFYRFPDAAAYRDKTGLPTADAESAALARYLNAQYASGANAGKYVFLRLNADTVQPTFRTIRIYSANAADPALRPTLTYTLETPTATAPTVAAPAAASPAVVTGTSTDLSVLGQDATGEANLKYTWVLTGTSPAAVSFSENASNSAKNTTATFTAAGQYTFSVTITNTAGLSVTSDVSVTVNPTLSGLIVTPGTAQLGLGGQANFAATGVDQFGKSMALASTPSWSLTTGSVGSINASGLYSSPTNGSGGSAGVVATIGGVSSAAATITVVNSAPMITTPASGSVDSTGKSINLTVAATDDGGETGLTYTWTILGIPAAPITFSSNSSNAAKMTSAALTQAGVYSFSVTISDGENSVTSNVDVTVSQLSTTVTLSPTQASVGLGQTTPFIASVFDQFGSAITAPQSILWSLTNGSVGSIDSNGLYSAPTTGTGGSAGIIATVGSISSAPVLITVTNAAPTIKIAASAQLDPAGKSVSLSVLAADDGGESFLTYTWSVVGTPPAPVVFGSNGSNASKNSTATLSKAGSYSFLVTAKDAAGLSVTSNVGITVAQVTTRLAVTPSSATVNAGTTKQFSASAYDQFDSLFSVQPTFTWSVSASGGSINLTGLYTAPATAGSATVTVGASGKTASAAITIVAPPAAPTNLTAKKQANNKVKLTWRDNASNETGFYVWTSTDGVTWSRLATLASSSGTGMSLGYTTQSFTTGLRYFRIDAFNSFGSTSSNIVSIVI